MQSRFIEVDGVKTRYFDEGSGPTVVLLHGAALAIDSEFTWFRQLESLTASHRVIAFDQPGFGQTPLPNNAYMGREQRSHHAVAFLRELGIKSAVLVGHSEGGYIATRIAIVAPNLVSAVIVVTSGSTAPMLGGAADDAWIAASAVAYSVGEVTEETYVAGLKGGAFDWDGRLESIARSNIRRAMDDGQAERMRNLPAEESDMASYMQTQAEYIQPFLGGILAPSLLIWAAEDPTVPIERGVALMRAWPGSDLVVLSGAGHNVMHDRHLAFDAVVRDWISRPKQAMRAERVL